MFVELVLLVAFYGVVIATAVLLGIAVVCVWVSG